MRIALYTFGMFRKRADHPDNDEFHALNDGVLAAMGSRPGFIARSGYDGDPGPKSWGIEIYPRFYSEVGDGWCPVTLSLWQDLDSAFSATYFGPHIEVFTRGREWFLKPKWPPYVLWWENETTTPSWADAVDRHHRLHDLGTSPHAFTFKTAFDADGEPFPVRKTKLSPAEHQP